MNSKWYIGTFIILLALIGLNQEQTKVANQQIELQFTEAEMTSATSHEAVLASITEKLQTLGIANIEIVENDDAQLSIRYYSDIDTHSVGEFLAEDSELFITYGDIDQLPFDVPTDQLPESCSLVVSDLQQQTDGGLGLNGKLAYELNQDYKRFSNPIVLPTKHTISLEQDAFVKVAYRIHTVIAIAIDNTSHAIPEVRAGPSLYRNS